MTGLVCRQVVHMPHLNADRTPCNSSPPGALPRLLLLPSASSLAHKAEPADERRAGTSVVVVVLARVLSRAGDERCVRNIGDERKPAGSRWQPVLG